MTTLTFRDADSFSRLGTALYVRVEGDQRAARASGLLVNAATEGIVTSVFYSGQGVASVGNRADADHRAVCVQAVVDALPATVVYFLESEMPPPPWTSFAARSAAVKPQSDDSPETRIRWLGEPNAEQQHARELTRRLARRALLLEPFNRALVPIETIKDVGAACIPPLTNYFRREGAVEWPHTFHSFQKAGIAALVERRSLLLADDMGLGKTVQSIAALRILFRTARLESALLVVPAAVMGQWHEALNVWAPELRVSAIRGNDRAWQWNAAAHVFLTTFETLRSDFTENPYSPPRRRIWGVVVLDEAQKIKNSDVDIARICKRLPRHRSWALTGTPLENSVDDLRSICEFLIDSDDHERLVDLSVLRSVHADLQLRRRKNDVLTELPAKTVNPLYLELTPAQRATYDLAECEGIVWLKGLGQSASITHVLELITRLKQICNFCPRTGESTKITDLKGRLSELKAQGHKSLIFSQYVDEPFGVAAIANAVADMEPLLYHGKLAGDERDQVLNKFRAAHEAVPLLLSLRAGGQGLNLQEASYVIHFDRWWNPALERQAEDRSHRMGQQLPVTVYTYTCRNTIEERIDSIIQTKKDLFDEWVDPVTIEKARGLDSTELFGLFGLETPERRKH